MKLLFAATALFCLSIQANGQLPTKPRVLLIGKTEYNTTTSSSGGGVIVGGAVIGGATGTTSVSQHTETWEAMRRFIDDCKGISLVTNPEQPHDFTIVMDYEKYPGSILGPVTLYQLVTLKPDGSPVLITKKQYLRNLIKPTCAAIMKASQ